ncbi:MAG: hypothetical protein J0L89_10445 [Xanthomonadales bacterium]|nr:hypothetical protein [Xanthomonadales bacterium]
MIDSDALAERVCDALVELSVPHEIYAYPCDMPANPENLLVATSVQTFSGEAYFVEDCERRSWLVLRHRQQGAGSAQRVSVSTFVDRQFDSIMQVLTDTAGCARPGSTSKAAH